MVDDLPMKQMVDDLPMKQMVDDLPMKHMTGKIHTDLPMKQMVKNRRTSLIMVVSDLDTLTSLSKEPQNFRPLTKGIYR